MEPERQEEVIFLIKRLLHLQTTTDDEEQCLPFEYPRLHDCETGGDFIIYQERLTKEKDKGKKKEKDKEKEKEDKDMEKEEKDEDNEKEKEDKEKDKEKDKEEKYEKKNKKGKCKEKYKKKKDKKKDKENGSMCDRFAITFAVPKFQVKGRYDPCEGIICSGNTFSLAFSLLMLIISHTLFRMK